jgi:hypothetical protein
MSRVLSEYMSSVTSTDIHDYGFGAVADALAPGSFPLFDFVITNPPFKQAEDFARLGLMYADVGTALLVRTAFLESVGRHERLFSKSPPTDILQFTERVPIVKGRLDANIWTATSYCWLVWTSPIAQETRFHWLPPCRKRLERPGDYDNDLLHQMLGDRASQTAV